MRKIEFKAVKDDMSNVKFVFGQLVYDAVGTPRITEVDSSGQGLTFHTCLKNTECQFTGILDKNEKRIFENDIVQVAGNVRYKVVYVEKDDDFEVFAGFALLNIQKEVMFHFDSYAIDKLEIIGNSFQNPELLDGVC